jgi:hypothetical protein
LKKNLILDIISLNEKLFKLFLLVRCIIDLYLFRRIIDKDYVETAIAYSGIFHTLHLIDLFRNYNFNITHNTLSLPDYDFDKLINHLDELLFEILKADINIFESTQCINLKGFPENFN